MQTSNNPGMIRRPFGKSRGVPNCVPQPRAIHSDGCPWTSPCHLWEYVPTMSEPLYRHVQCTIVVLTVAETQLQGDPISDSLREDLLAGVDRSGAMHVVLDFQRVHYLSSVAFRPLLSLHRKLKERNGRLVLCGMSQAVAEVFYVTRLVSSSGTSAAPFEMQADVPAAVASLYRPVSHKAV